MFSSALCKTDDASCFLVIRLGPKTSECGNNVIVKSTVRGCEVTNCATTLHGFNKHASSRREAVSVSRGVPRYTEKNYKHLRLLSCVDRSTRPLTIRTACDSSCHSFPSCHLPGELTVSRDLFRGLAQVVRFRCQYRQVEFQVTCSF